jgi:serine/threonine protein kinase
MTMSTMTAGEEHLPKPGEVLAGKYKIEKIIGKGGMGAVLAAHHEMLGERIAIKFLLGEIAQNPEAVARFNNEAKNAFKIQSEHVCRIMDVGNERGMPFMVMEFLNGEDLSQMLEKRGALPVEEAVDYVLQALEAIAQAHAFGIVHRDLKPANLFLHKRSDGSALIKVLDFGIAKASNPFGETGGHNLTSTKSMLGSPLYMSPEQLRSAKSVDARADIWALGVILYELLTGTVPFNGETLGELFIAILEQPPPPVSHKRPDVPQVLSDAVMRCLQRTIDHRFANVAELAQALAPCAPARSFTSVERVTQALGLPKPTGMVAPMPGSMPDARAAMPSYAGNPNTPNPYAASQSGQRPAQFSSSNSGVHQFSPQGGTQLLGSQTNSGWGNTAGGTQPPTSKAPLIAGLAAAGLLVVGLAGGGIYLATHKSSASPTPTTTDTAKPEPTDTAKTAETATTTATAKVDPTASAPSASATTTATTTATATTTTAQTATSHTNTGKTGTGKTGTTTTATTAATSQPTAKPTSTGGAAFDPLKIDRRP